MREARFATGATCPHCASRAIQRWGTFSGRQRYRCTKCRRTFSDLTDSVLAYTKRLSCWPDFMVCWHGARTVRRTAQLAGVHSTTAFRWRHRLCDAVRSAEQPELHGLTEAIELKFAYSQKGQRTPQPQRRPRTVLEQRRRRPVSVVILRDRRGVVAGDVAGGVRPSTGQLLRLYGNLLQSDAVLLSAHRRYAPIAVFARALGVPHVRVAVHERDPLFHLANATSHAHRLRAWLEPFRGVATRYLSNYLCWYRQLEPLLPDVAARRLLARCCGAAYQQSPRTDLKGPEPGGPPDGSPMPPGASVEESGKARWRPSGEGIRGRPGRRVAGPGPCSVENGLIGGRRAASPAVRRLVSRQCRSPRRPSSARRVWH